jgi:hypothetical protein
MGKFIITESDKQNILGMYGLINEQTNNIPITGDQPVNNTDWDLVHGILGSKRIDDDLEKRVGDALQNGNYRVSGVKISSFKQGDKIITTGNVTLTNPTQGQKPHKYFTTRGSIGGSYEQRHDTQVLGLSDRLKNSYKGEVKVFGPFIVQVKGTNVFYKQSFFAIEGGGSSVTQNTDEGGLSKTTKLKTIVHNNNPNTLREELKKMGGVYNPQIKTSPNEVTIYYRESGPKPLKLSYIFSDSGELDKVYEKVSLSNSIFNEKEYNVGNVKGYIIFIE